MEFFRSARSCLAVLLCFAFAATSAHASVSTPASASAIEEAGLRLEIEDAKTYVGFAAIKLSVEDLRKEGDALVGTYRIRVPMMSSKNDDGAIVIPISRTLAALGQEGGEIVGEAISVDPERAPNGIRCRIIPEADQKIILSITTPDRVLDFTSRYRVMDPSD